uniref:Receptor L-domain domain-containing protein n=1 Tax=Anopheles maculatus TaxID=74869 RepID=A0A182SIB7_9DIPT
MHRCEEDCINRRYETCETGIINMLSNEGWKKLLRIVENDKAIHIQKLIVPNSPSGPFLQKIHQLFETVIYANYREPVFQLPEGNTIREIVIMSAIGLKAFTAGPNTHLEILNVQQCTMDRVPQTLPKMVGMTLLSITMCMLSVLRLDMFVENENLTFLDVSYNQIRQIIPATIRSGKTISIEKLVLSGNRLEHLDMGIFASMAKLVTLYIMENRLTHIGVTVP